MTDEATTPADSVPDSDLVAVVYPGPHARVHVPPFGIATAGEPIEVDAATAEGLLSRGWYKPGEKPRTSSPARKSTARKSTARKSTARKSKPRKAS